MKKSKVKKLQFYCEELWKKCCLARDGKRCMVKESFPELDISHSTIYQVDHCFSRTNKHLFFDVRNGTVVCSTCNSTKSWNQRSIGRLIDEIVKLREGNEVFERMRSIDIARCPNLNFKNIEWLENTHKSLTTYLEEQCT